MDSSQSPQISPSLSQQSVPSSVGSDQSFQTALSITPAIDSPTYTDSRPPSLRSTFSDTSFTTEGSIPLDSWSSIISFPIPESGNAPTIIVVMGPTGTGKSNFIRIATGDDTVQVGDQLASCTAEIQAIRCQHPQQEREYILVDTPGFDDTYKDEAEILNKVATWLLETYQQQWILSGVLYLHNISDNRMTNTRLRNLDTFKKICGSSAYRSVGLVTTHWDEIQSPETGIRKEDELCEDYWKVLTEKGAKIGRFENTCSSAWKIIDSLSLERRLLQIQNEMGVKKRPLSKTKAGQALYSWLDRASQSLKSVLKRLKMMKRKLSTAPGNGDAGGQAQLDLEDAVLNATTKLETIEVQKALLRTK